jgi:O-antigen/teichoic acid export membrane protein
VVATTVGMWTIVRWRPHHFIDRSSLRRIWSYSGNVFGFNVVTYWARNLDDLLIGRYGTAADLGYYSRAYMVMLLPVQQVVMVIGRVLFPALSRLQHDYDRLRAAYVRALALMIALTAPVSLGLAAAAGPFIDVAYGHRWHPAAQLLTILAVSGPAQLIAGTAGSLFQAIGRTGAQFRRGLINAAVTVVAIVIGLHWGATGVAVALLIKYYALMPQSVRMCWREIGLTLTDGLRAVASPVLASFIMAAVMYTLGVTSGLSALPLLLLEAVVGLVVYVLVFRLLDRALLLDLINVAVPRRLVPARLLAATYG